MAVGTAIVVGKLRYVHVRKMWGVREQDVLEIWRLDSPYPHPTWEIPREPANSHIWALFDEMVVYHSF